jgi:shikimate 5-dehydrogenase
VVPPAVLIAELAPAAMAALSQLVEPVVMVGTTLLMLIRLTLLVVIATLVETALLKAARRIGCATADGGHMNVGQAIGAFKLFTGLDADAARMDAHFRRLVA